MIIRVGAWQDSINLVAINMVDFDLILGQDFIRQSCVVVAPHLGCVIFIHPHKISMVGTIKVPQTNQIISTLSLGWAACKNSE